MDTNTKPARYQLGGEGFSSKEAVYRRYQEIRDRIYPRYSRRPPIYIDENHKDGPFLLDLFRVEYPYAQWVVFREHIDGRPSHDLIMADGTTRPLASYRTLDKDTAWWRVKKLRSMIMRPVGPPRCMRCGAEGPTEAHHAEVSFRALVDQWLISVGVRLERLEFIQADEAGDLDRLADPELDRGWREFHALFAQYEFLCEACHRVAHCGRG